MAKTNEELNKLKNEYETLNTKLQELTEDELKQVTGGESEHFIWLYEQSFDHAPDNRSGSIQDVIGEWSLEEH